jgi:hypothetical protein
MASTPALAILPIGYQSEVVSSHLNRPDDSGGSPDGCIPMGIVKHPDGSVWAAEKCNGHMYFTRMSEK